MQPAPHIADRPSNPDRVSTPTPVGVGLASDAPTGSDLSFVREAARPALLDDPRSKRILAKTIYRELRESGVNERDVLTIATELLALVAGDLRKN